MKIKDKLIEPYEIHFDGVQYSLGIPKIDKKGVESLSGALYYTKLDSVLLKIIDLKLGSKDEVLTLKEFYNNYLLMRDELVENIRL